MAYYPPMPMMMQPGMYGQGPPQPLRRGFSAPMPWEYGIGMGGVPGQPQAQQLGPPAPPPPGGKFGLAPPPPPTTPMGTAAVIGASSEGLLQQAAENKQAAERKKILAQQRKAAKIGGWQTAGSVLGGLGGLALGLAAPPFAPLLAAGGAAIGGQIGRSAAGGDIGFGTAAPGIMQTAATIPRVKRDYRMAQREAAVNNYIGNMDPSMYEAYAMMPAMIASQFNQGNFKLFEETWVPMYQSGASGMSIYGGGFPGDQGPPAPPAAVY